MGVAVSSSTDFILVFFENNVSPIPLACVFTLLIALGPWPMPLSYTDNALGIC